MHSILFHGRETFAWKANLHAHSTTSDGRYTPEELIALYAEAGYDVLAFTDHKKTNPVSTYSGRGMSLISGIEMHPAGPRGILWHLLALGVPEDFDGSDFPDASAALTAAKQAGALAYVAHPYWCGLTPAELDELCEFDGLEVSNSACRYNSKNDSSAYWDALLDAGRRLNAIAVDDTHRNWDLFHNWTQIIADENTPEAMLDALKQGNFYATQGPEFTRLSYVDGVFEAEFSPAEAVMIASEKHWGHCCCVEGRRYGRVMPDEVSEVTSIHFERRRDLASEVYFRVIIRDARGRYAWTNPFYLDETRTGE